MSAAALPPQSQEEILDAALAALGEHDIPPDDDAWAVPDPDCGRPAELAGLTTEELDESANWPTAESGGLTTDELDKSADWPTGRAARAAPTAEADDLAASASIAAEGEDLAASALAAAELIQVAASGPAGLLPRDGSGGGAGFADGGVLDVLVPGVSLAAFADAAHTRLASLTDDELIGVLRAWRRQTSWAQARELAAVAELARRRPAERTSPAPAGQFPGQLSEFTADEVALALTLTRRSAAMTLDLALDLAALPATAAALETGQIDLPRARVITDGVTGLAGVHATAVQAAVLPAAPGMTTGQLRAAVARAVLAADPDAARKQREEELKDARVECWTDPAGTANLAGRNLPSAQALAADQRLCQIATAWKKQIAAAWGKQIAAAREHADSSGRPRPRPGMDLLRARAYLALLLGLPVDAPPADLLPADLLPADGPRADGSPAGLLPADRSPADGSPAPGADTHPGGCHPYQDRSVGPAHPGQGNKPAADPDGQQISPGLRRPGPGDTLPPLAGSVYLTLPLTTLLGLSDAPGEAAGYGPIDPDTARALARAAAGHPVAGWNLIITDPHGHAVGYGHAPRPRRTRGRDGDGWTITLTTERIAGGHSP